MARIRTIKPSFFLNETVASLPFHWRLLFVGLWTQADREGRLEDRPMRLKAALFPYDDLDVNDGLGCLANAGLITRYDGNVHEQRLIVIPTWRKHQQPNVREADSDLPPPPGESTVLAPVEPFRKGREGKGREQEGVPIALRANFDRFWNAYPRKIGKDAALAVWRRLRPDNDLTTRMIAAVQAQMPHWDDPKFIPHPRTWLHQGRWQDESFPVRSGSGVASRRPAWAQGTITEDA